MCISQVSNVFLAHTLHMVTVVTIQGASGLGFSTLVKRHLGRPDGMDRNFTLSSDIQEQGVINKEKLGSRQAL